MPSISRSLAKDRFAAIEKERPKILEEGEERAMKVSEKTSRLKALRLAKETADNELNQKLIDHG